MVNKFFIGISFFLAVYGCMQTEKSPMFLHDEAKSTPPQIVHYENADDEWDSLYIANKTFFDEFVKCVYSGKLNVIRGGYPLSKNDTMRIWIADMGESLNDSLELLLGPKSIRLDTTTRTKTKKNDPGIMTLYQIDGFNLYFKSGNLFAVTPFCDEFRCRMEFVEKLRSCSVKYNIDFCE